MFHRWPHAITVEECGREAFHRIREDREQNNAGALHMLQRPIAITNDRSQMDTIFVADEDTKLLRHAHIIPE
jgi:hypothetical protein